MFWYGTDSDQDLDLWNRPVDLDPLGIGIVLADLDPNRRPGPSIWIRICININKM